MSEGSARDEVVLVSAAVWEFSMSLRGGDGLAEKTSVKRSAACGGEGGGEREATAEVGSVGSDREGDWRSIVDVGGRLLIDDQRFASYEVRASSIT